MKGFVTLTGILAVGIGGMLWIFTDGFAGHAAKGKAPKDENVPELQPFDDEGGQSNFGSDRAQPGSAPSPFPSTASGP